MSDEKQDEKKPADNNMMVKAVAGVFGMVVAPVLVAFGMKFVDVIGAHLTPKPDAAKTESGQKEPPKSDSGSSSDKTAPASGNTATATTGKPEIAKSDPKADVAKEAPTQLPAAEKNVAAADPGPGAKTNGDGSDVTKPGKVGGKGFRKKAQAAGYENVGPVVRLFNQRDLSGWYKFVDKTSTSNAPPGRDKDPDGVYKFGNGMIHISGQYWGTLTTKETYENYHLTVEFRWGKKTWGNVEGHARTSGVLLHGFGKDGAHMGWAPQSIKCQITEGGTGDLLCFNIKENQDVSIAVEAAMAPGKKQKQAFTYKPGEPLTTVTVGFVRRLGNTDDWQNVTDFHRDGDIEKPSGEWNTLKCICLGDRIKVILNGKVVNEASNVKPSKGRISLQSHGAEIFFRKVELQKIAAK